MKTSLIVGLFAVMAAGNVSGQNIPEGPSWLTYRGNSGPGKGKHIVFIAADQEYRSEQSMPMLARVLSEHHGFDCTVWYELPALLGIHSREEFMPGLP